MTLAYYGETPFPEPPLSSGDPAPALPGNPKKHTVVNTASNSISTTTAFNGLVTTTYRYKAQGLLNNKTQRVDQTWKGETATVYRAAYDTSNGRLMRTFDAEDNETNYSYQIPEGNSTFSPEQTITVTDPLGHSSTAERDEAGNTINVIDPTGVTRHLIYDARNRLIEITNTADQTLQKLTYNDRGDILTLEDALGSVTAMVWDDFHGASLLKSIQTPRRSIRDLGSFRHHWPDGIRPFARRRRQRELPVERRLLFRIHH